MERITISLDDELLAEFDRYMQQKGYVNRSEAIRDLVRERLERKRLAEDQSGRCIACLSYIYNHHERELVRRLTDAQHASHDLVRSTLHVHLDHENCMEVAILEGETGAVRRFSDAVMAETGVRHGKLSAVPVETRATGKHSYLHHAHGGQQPHTHIRPKT